MAVNNFVFKQKWVDRKVAGTKKNFFFFFFDPTWTHTLNLHSGGFATTTFCFKRYSTKYEKKPNDNACFFTFFTTLNIIWPKFRPKTTPTLIFFVGF